MPLTPHQQEKFDEICESIDAKRRHVLIGYAGTGKSYMCAMLKEKYPSAVFGTPTNKAAKVLTNDMGVQATTIHKILGLRIKHGKLEQSGPVARFAGPLFIDECSMIGTELYSLLEKLIPANVPIVFIGDPFQLPPVKETHSASFDTPHKSFLFEIVRQAADNPLIQMSMDIREKGFLADTIPYGGSIRKLPEGISLSQLAQVIAKTYERGGVYAAWRNATVDMANKMVHAVLYGVGSPEYCLGERIVLNSPWQDKLSNQTIGNIGDEFTIKRMTPTSHRKFKTWDIYVEGDDGAVLRPIYAIRDEGKAEYEAHLKSLADNKRWGEFYGLQEFFTSIAHTYAFTCHKLQGSSYQKVIVNINDICRNPNKAERDRCMYVAITRTRDEVIFH